MNQKEYWDKKIILWERSSYQAQTQGLSLVEKFATKFRGPIKKRREILLELLRGKIKDTTILELGCASGGLCFEFLRLGAKKTVGIDISQEAISAAKDKAAALGFQDRAEFCCMDVRDSAEIPASDYVVGLGFIDYIDILTLRKLLGRIKSRFIFSFPEKKINLVNILNHLYLKSQGCSSFHRFRRSDFTDIPGAKEPCRFVTIEKMVFITNFDSVSMMEDKDGAKE
jgi:SAM-dependent methyltransferase